MDRVKLFKCYVAEGKGIIVKRGEGHAMQFDKKGKITVTIKISDGRRRQNLIQMDIFCTPLFRLAYANTHGIYVFQHCMSLNLNLNMG